MYPDTGKNYELHHVKVHCSLQKLYTGRFLSKISDSVSDLDRPDKMMPNYSDPNPDPQHWNFNISKFYD